MSSPSSVPGAGAPRDPPSEDVASRAFVIGRATAVLEALPLPVLTAEPGGRVTCADPAAHALFSADVETLTPEERARRRVARHVDGSPTSSGDLPTMRAIRGERLRNLEHCITHAGGTPAGRGPPERAGRARPGGVRRYNLRADGHALTPAPAGRDPYVVALAVLFALEWTALAIAPRYRQDWALENALSVALVVALVALRDRLPFSRLSYTAIFVFLTLHTIGAHYTYSEVPYDEWSRALTGRALGELFGWERNHYDRLVHLAYGSLLAPPIRRLLMRFAGVRGIWSYYLPLAVTSSTSADYELIEWGAAMLFGGELGMAYLGTQGDVWDAQKDMALAVLGAALSLSLVALGDFRRDR